MVENGLFSVYCEIILNSVVALSKASLLILHVNKSLLKTSEGFKIAE